MKTNRVYMLILAVLMAFSLNFTRPVSAQAQTEETLPQVSYLGEGKKGGEEFCTTGGQFLTIKHKDSRGWTGYGQDACGEAISNERAYSSDRPLAIEHYYNGGAEYTLTLSSGQAGRLQAFFLDINYATLSVRINGQEVASLSGMVSYIDLNVNETDEVTITTYDSIALQKLFIQAPPPVLAATISGVCPTPGVDSSDLNLTIQTTADGEPVAMPFELVLPNGDVQQMTSNDNGSANYLFEGAEAYIGQAITVVVDGEVADAMTITAEDFVACTSPHIPVKAATISGVCPTPGVDSSDLNLTIQTTADGEPIAMAFELVLPDGTTKNLTSGENGSASYLFEGAETYVGQDVKVKIDGEEVDSITITAEIFVACTSPQLIPGVCLASEVVEGTQVPEEGAMRTINTTITGKAARAKLNGIVLNEGTDAEWVEPNTNGIVTFTINAKPGDVLAIEVLSSDGETIGVQDCEVVFFAEPSDEKECNPWAWGKVYIQGEDSPADRYGGGELTNASVYCRGVVNHLDAHAIDFTMTLQILDENGQPADAQFVSAWSLYGDGVESDWLLNGNTASTTTGNIGQLASVHFYFQYVTAQPGKYQVKFSWTFDHPITGDSMGDYRFTSLVFSDPFNTELPSGDILPAWAANNNVVWVRNGEDLEDVANRIGISYQALLDMNYRMLVQNDLGCMADQNHDNPTGCIFLPVGMALRTTWAAGYAGLYVATAGQSMANVAAILGTTVDTLMHFNHLQSADVLQGQVLIAPAN